MKKMYVSLTMVVMMVVGSFAAGEESILDPGHLEDLVSGDKTPFIEKWGSESKFNGNIVEIFSLNSFDPEKLTGRSYEFLLDRVLASVLIKAKANPSFEGKLFNTYSPELISELRGNLEKITEWAETCSVAIPTRTFTDDYQKDKDVREFIRDYTIAESNVIYSGLIQTGKIDLEFMAEMMATHSKTLMPMVTWAGMNTEEYISASFLGAQSFDPAEMLKKLDVTEIQLQIKLLTEFTVNQKIYGDLLKLITNTAVDQGLDVALVEAEFKLKDLEKVIEMPTSVPDEEEVPIPSSTPPGPRVSKE